MNSTAMLKQMADYSHWMNQRLYTVCAGMKDEERKCDLNTFFRSIHGTLNHILLVDRLWFARIHNETIAIPSFDQELFADFRDLDAARKSTDDDITSLIKSLKAQDFDRVISYTSLVSKTETTLPLGIVMLHLFMHQTHHRGQVTAMISQLGYDYGSTDISYFVSSKWGK